MRFWHGLRNLSSLTLISLAFPEDSAELAAMLASGCGAQLTQLVLGDNMTLSFIRDVAVQAVPSHCKSLKLLDVSGCMELTDAGGWVGLLLSSAYTHISACCVHNQVVSACVLHIGQNSIQQTDGHW